MRTLMLSTAVALITTMATAEDVALVVGTEDYDTLGRLNRGDEPSDGASVLSSRGFDVLRITDGNAAQVGRALDGFVARVPQAERVIVILSGRFITDGDRTWYLTSDAPLPSYLGLDDTAISVDSIMQVMARQPGSAILMLAYDNDEVDVHDPWISEGLGDLDIPQGVTVLAGGPRAVARFMSDELVRPGGDLARLVAANRNIQAAGYLPRRMIFQDQQTTGLPAAQEQGGAGASERALWSGAVALDTIQAYQNYLDRYPRGEFVGQAEAGIEVIRSEPFRQARLIEEGLRIPRAQRREIQRHLTLLNFDTRGVDGIFGQGTRNAVRNWQQQNGFPQTSYLNANQIERLAAQANRREQELAAQQEERDLEARRAENAFWEETGATGTARGLRAYIERYPNGRYTEIARQRLEAAETASADERALEERALWVNAQSVDQVAAYENYLRSFPNGRYVQNARQRIAALNNAQPDNSGGIAGRLEQAERDLGLNNLTRRLVEAHLQSLGMNPGAADGEFDAQARQAIRRYQNERGLQVTGYLDARTAAMMLSEAQ